MHNYNVFAALLCEGEKFENFEEYVHHRGIFLRFIFDRNKLFLINSHKTHPYWKTLQKCAAKVYIPEALVGIYFFFKNQCLCPLKCCKMSLIVCSNICSHFHPQVSCYMFHKGIKVCKFFDLKNKIEKYCIW